jgi:hypothetical protein
MANWLPVFVLPNINLKEPIEAKMAALADHSDSRVQQILRQIPMLAQFVQKFTDPFGVSLRPVMLILRDDAPKTFFTPDAMASFRDALAMSVVPLSRAKSIIWKRSFATYYSDWYDFYPWMLNTNHQHLVCHTPALAGLHVVSQFNGQCIPGLSPVVLDTTDIDHVLLQALMKRWHRRYATKRKRWADVALFRSLNMAVAASKMPAGVDVTLFDLGRSVSLWVSAFEILAHPKTSLSNVGLVYSLLERAAWQNNDLVRRRYRAFMTKNKAKQKSAPLRSLPCWLYGEIYHARNDFLHGNPIRENRLRAKKTGRALFPYPAMLYRMALAAFLPLPGTLTVPPVSDQKAYDTYIKKFFELFSEQRDIEKAIRTVRKKD